MRSLLHSPVSLSSPKTKRLMKKLPDGTLCDMKISYVLRAIKNFSWKIINTSKKEEKLSWQNLKTCPPNCNTMQFSENIL